LKNNFKSKKMKMFKISKAIIICLITSLGLLASCSEDEGVTNIPSENLTKKLEDAFAFINDDPSRFSSVISVEIPSKNYSFKRAFGNATPNQEMTIDDQFYSASIGKMITATMILKYAEEGVLNLDDPITDFLSPSVVNGLNINNGIDYSSQITIRQLVGHKSGLGNYATDGTPGANGLPPAFNLVLDNPNQFWSGLETINWHKQNTPSFGLPNEAFYYSDTGYVLLGLIIESISQKAVDVEVYEKILQPLGMDRTYYYYHGATRGAISNREPSNAYLDDIALNFPAMSIDWTGGGLITSTEDLTKFLKAVVKGNFLNSQSKALMQTFGKGEFETTEYGLGLERIFNTSNSKFYGLGHGGLTGSMAYYLPAYDAYVVYTINQLASEKTPEELLDLIWEALEEVQL
jgi:D-alanyl-D-alanine carboxypeptidase